MLDRYTEARKQLDRLFAVVAPEFLYERPIPERHRIAFYVGHVEAFDWNLFQTAGAGLEPYCPDFDRLFAFGIDPVDGGLPTDQPSDWPPLASIRRYTAGVRDRIDHALPGFVSSHPLLVETAIEHRLMHAETLAYMLHQLPLSQKLPPDLPPPPPAGDFRPAAVAVPAGETVLGREPGPGFGWDNEYAAHRVQVSAFAIDRFKVTNGEYLAFVESGGYAAREFWEASDWEWKEQAGIGHPAFWTRRDGQWFCRTMFDEVPLPATWPVYASFAEASAYARWAGKSLPSEAQWQRAAFGAETNPLAPTGNFDFRHWDPVPVDAPWQSDGPFGAVGMTGNGWEWTATPFAPFPGFVPYPFYPGYSADFFDGRHFVMKGASPRTAACMARPSFRNWFQRHYPYVYAGFRCVREDAQ